MVTRVLTAVPQLLEPLIFQPLISIGEDDMLYSSMNSSLPPACPRVVNSLITTEFDGTRVAVAVRVAVLVGPPGVKVAVGVGTVPFTKRMLLPAHMKLWSEVKLVLHCTSLPIVPVRFSIPTVDSWPLAVGLTWE